MELSSTPVLLLIADISGYTRFLRLHALATSHARQIIVRLLTALVDAARPPLQVAEIEGDAVFFYALAAGGNLEHTAVQVKAQILRLFQVFNQEIAALEKVAACVCEACTSVGQLRLKQVAHCGEATVERIDRFEKLFGLDVVLVHRMLKNTVPSTEYVMMTDPAYAACVGFYDLEPERRIEQFEGIGAVETLVFYDAALARVLGQVPDEPPAVPRARTLGWKLKMHGRTILGLIGLRRIEAVFDPPAS